MGARPSIPPGAGYHLLDRAAAAFASRKAITELGTLNRLGCGIPIKVQVSSSVAESESVAFANLPERYPSLGASAKGRAAQERISDQLLRP